MATEQSTVAYKDIPGWPGYRAGDDGSVWYAWVTCRAGRRLTDRWRPMKLSPGTRGYLRVNLTPEGGGPYTTFRVHRLVLEAFVGPCPPGMECRHSPDPNKTNNRLENLSWGTPVENRDDNHTAAVYRSGERHPMAELTDDDVRAIRTRYATGGVGQKELAAEFHVSVPTVSMIVRRRTWRHVV